MNEADKKTLKIARILKILIALAMIAAGSLVFLGVLEPIVKLSAIQTEGLLLMLLGGYVASQPVQIIELFKDYGKKKKPKRESERK